MCIKLEIGQIVVLESICSLSQGCDRSYVINTILDRESQIKYSIRPKEDDFFLGRHEILCKFILCVEMRE